MIREENSYESSDVFDLMKDFRGKAVLITGNRDEIIPERVIQLYVDALNHSTPFIKVRLEECPHQIHGWLEKRNEQRLKVTEMIRSCLTD